MRKLKREYSDGDRDIVVYSINGDYVIRGIKTEETAGFVKYLKEDCPKADIPLVFLNLNAQGIAKLRATLQISLSSNGRTISSDLEEALCEPKN